MTKKHTLEGLIRQLAVAEMRSQELWAEQERLRAKVPAKFRDHPTTTQYPDRAEFGRKLAEHKAANKKAGAGALDRKTQGIGKRIDSLSTKIANWPITSQRDFVLKCAWMAVFEENRSTWADTIVQSFQTATGLDDTLQLLCRVSSMIENPEASKIRAAYEAA